MKRKIFYALAFGVIAAPAYAQSSVTLYGIVDEGFDFTNNSNGHSAYQLTSGYEQGSRWGLKGNENLGGGTSAIFTLENGFNLSNGAFGQQSRMFGRQAFVGLSNAQYGTITLGRQYDALVDNFASVTGTAWGGYLFTTPYDNDNTDNTLRFSNTVKYTSPTIAGFRLGGTYSFSNANNFANNRAYSVGGQYASSGLVVTAAYIGASNPGATAGGTLESGAANFNSSKLRIFGAGANYTIGPAKIGFVYTNSSVIKPTPGASAYVSAIVLPAGTTLNDLKFQNFEANVLYQVNPALFVGAQYVYTTLNVAASSGTSQPKYHSLGLMADYSMSKRTDFYVQAAYQQVVNGHTGSVLDHAFIPGAAGLSSTNRQLALRIAMRQKF